MSLAASHLFFAVGLLLTLGLFSAADGKPKRPAGVPAAAVEPSEFSFETHWFTQLVDHFTWANQDTFQQRFLVNRKHWAGRNYPILFYCGNEGDIEVFANNTGWMWQNAQKLGALLVFAEHRFYGKSLPYPIDPTKVTPNETQRLGYLSSEQALADYARLIYALRNNLFEATSSPVIAVGGSYGGMLAAWMRMKYPNAVQGALAASAPILQFPGMYECGAFNRIVTKDFEDYNKNCSLSIASSWQSLRQLGQQPNGLQQVSAIFRTCKPLSDQADLELLIQLLSSIWVNLAMSDYATEANLLSPLPAFPIKHVCAQLQTSPLDLAPLDAVGRIALASQVYTNYTSQLECLDIANLLYDPMDVLWDFQACTEMVMPICADGINDMFDPQAFNVTSLVTDCQKRWGVKTQVDKVKMLYGDSRSLVGASNIIFSTCSRDPWSAGCPQTSIESNSIHAIRIKGACHHEDLRASGPNDSQEIKQARQDELNIITDWISKHYDTLRSMHLNETLSPADSI